MKSLKHGLVALALLLLSLICTPIKASELSYNRIIFFGDSLSDNGNLYNRLFGYVPESPPYYKGRFTNGETWAELVAAHFQKLYQVKSENYAVAGTTAVFHNPFDSYLPYTLGDEIDNFLVRWFFDDKDKNLYIIWIGGNDYIAGDSDVQQRTTTVIKSIQTNIETLIAHGGKQFLLMNLPDLAKSPAGKSSPNMQYISDLTTTHNKKLADLTITLKNKYPQINVQLFDVYSGFIELIQNPEKYNQLYQTQINNPHDACWKGGYRVRSMTDHQINELTAKIEAKLKAESHSQNSRSESSKKAIHEQAVKLANHVLNTPDLAVAYEVSTEAARGETACVNPQNYVFWDKMHPSAAVHTIFSARMIEFISQYFR